jgi:pimeloyl-ACP methyl ester carboxylesterase
MPAPRVIDVGKVSIEYVLSGNTQPPIVLVNGGGGPLDGWSRVYGPLLRYGTVVAYNRFGIGKSSRPSEPQTGALIVGTLRDFLAEIRQDPPFVLVGHSLGGLYVNLFARMLPQAVSGVVFVEAAHPDDRRISDHRPGWVRALNGVLGVGNPLRRDRAFDETRWVNQTCRQIEVAGPFPDVPVAVVTGGRRPPTRMMPEAAADLRYANQADLAALGPRSRHVTSAGSGHFPQLSEPGIVVDAVRWVIEQSGQRERVVEAGPVREVPSLVTGRRR